MKNDMMGLVASGELHHAGPAAGWTLLFPDRHPYAGGPGHYAAYLANADGFEVELVAEAAILG